ncbi:Hypothetical protein NTJ_04319 [Nesidiocoris tenuis]|uniref:Uncharacterized protein n=1 Tax=Nesidiocoris tenuis TaxID=355587 RepID=A0ABN7AGW9_9HEMI|nr:Hypothetical protein NTJ_04319 [Nesidiocoris tenuis]
MFADIESADEESQMAERPHTNHVEIRMEWAMSVMQHESISLALLPCTPTVLRPFHSRRPMFPRRPIILRPPIHPTIALFPFPQTGPSSTKPSDHLLLSQPLLQAYPSRELHFLICLSSFS